MRPRDAKPVLPVTPTLPSDLHATLDARLLTDQLGEEARTEAPLADVFSPAFLSVHAGVPDLGVLLAKAGLAPADGVDRDLLRALGPGTLDRVAAEHTDFETWAEFEEAATRAYVARRLLDFVL